MKILEGNIIGVKARSLGEGQRRTTTSHISEVFGVMLGSWGPFVKQFVLRVHLYGVLTLSTLIPP
jgi:hypothetical protein